MKIKTKVILGPPLDWAVAVAQGRWQKYIRDEARPLTSIIDIDFDDSKVMKVYVPGPSRELSGRRRDPYEVWSPSTNWSQGGPILEEHGIGTLYDSGSACRKPEWFATPDDQCTIESYEGEVVDPAFMVDEAPGVRGPTQLVAAMRCLVMKELGDTVEIPDGVFR